MPIAAGFLLIGLMVLGIVVTGAGVANGASSSQAAVTGMGSSSTAGGTGGPNTATVGSGKVSSKAAFSPNQRAFAAELQAKTGLDPAVIAGWMVAEEPLGATKTQGYGLQDWLNVGITDSGPLGAGNPVWQDPVKAADATAAWIAGTWSDPGFGHAAPGIRAILHTVGQSIDAQVSAIQNSGWASGGYPDLPGLVAQYR